MSNVSIERDSIRTRSKKRKLEDDELHYKTNITENPSKAEFDTPDDSMSELEEQNFIHRDGKMKKNKNSNQISSYKYSKKSKSPSGHEMLEETQLPIEYMPETKEYSGSDSNSKSRTNSLSSTPQKEEKNKKRLSLDINKLNSDSEYLPECKLKRQFSSKDCSSNKTSKKKPNQRSCSKAKMDISSGEEIMPQEELRPYDEYSEYYEKDSDRSTHRGTFENIDDISPIRKAKFKTNSESKESFSESSESNESIRENLTVIKPTRRNSCTFSIETDEKENYKPKKSNLLDKKGRSKALNKNKTKAKLRNEVEENFDNDSDETFTTSDSVINETLLPKTSTVIHTEGSQPMKNIKKKSLSSTISEESISEDSNSEIPSPQVKKKKPKLAAASPKTPNRKSQRIIEKQNFCVPQSDEQIPTPHKSSKKRTSSAKSSKTPQRNVSESEDHTPKPRRSYKKRSSTMLTPSQSFMSDELGLSWDTNCTPARRYSLRLRNLGSENGTPRSSIGHSSIGNTPTPSKRKQLMNIKKSRDLILESSSELDSDKDQAEITYETNMDSSRNAAVHKLSSKKMLKELDINDSDLNGYLDDPQPKPSRKSTPYRCKKLAGKDYQETEFDDSIPKKKGRRKTTNK